MRFFSHYKKKKNLKKKIFNGKIKKKYKTNKNIYNYQTNILISLITSRLCKNILWANIPIVCGCGIKGGLGKGGVGE